MRTIALWIIVLFCSYANAQSVPSLAEFDIELASSQGLPLSDEISFELITSKPGAVAKYLQNWSDINIKLVSNDKILIEMSERPQFLGKLSPKYLSDSFVIDTSEESTKEFASHFINSKSQPIELKQLAAYVNEYIDKPTYVIGFNIASVVATQRSGDCTEYAVLLTALARSIGLPARVIIGTVFIEEKEKISAFGHAWVEVWHKDQWNILDAALYKSQANHHFYLPAAELDQEGPGYGMSLVKATTFLPSKIRELRNVN